MDKSPKLGPAGLKKILALLQAHGVTAFEGMGIKVALTPVVAPPAQHPQARQQVRDTRVPARPLPTAYDDPKLWGPNGTPDF